MKIGWRAGAGGRVSEKEKLGTAGRPSQPPKHPLTPRHTHPTQHTQAVAVAGVGFFSDAYDLFIIGA